MNKNYFENSDCKDDFLWATSHSGFYEDDFFNRVEVKITAADKIDALLDNDGIKSIPICNCLSDLPNEIKEQMLKDFGKHSIIVRLAFIYLSACSQINDITRQAVIRILHDDFNYSEFIENLHETVNMVAEYLVNGGDIKSFRTNTLELFNKYFPVGVKKKVIENIYAICEADELDDNECVKIFELYKELIGTES